MGKVARGFVVMLDIDRVLAASEAELRAAAAVAAAADETPASHAIA
jgi:hypothetical protein